MQQSRNQTDGCHDHGPLVESCLSRPPPRLPSQYLPASPSTPAQPVPPSVPLHACPAPTSQRPLHACPAPTSQRVCQDVFYLLPPGYQSFWGQGPAALPLLVARSLSAPSTARPQGPDPPFPTPAQAWGEERTAAFSFWLPWQATELEGHPGEQGRLSLGSCQSPTALRGAEQVGDCDKAQGAPVCG